MVLFVYTRDVYFKAFVVGKERLQILLSVAVGVFRIDGWSKQKGVAHLG